MKKRNPKRLILVAGLVILAAVFSSSAATVYQDFSAEPMSQGWRVFGDSNLFRWDAATQNLRVTWDSRRPNSYFYLPLGTILGRGDDWSLGLDLQLEDITVGINPGKSSTFQLAFGFQNSVDATKTNFFRGDPARSPNLLEFDFFPDSGFGPTIWPAIWSTNSSPNYNGSGDFTILDLPVGVVMRVEMTYSATNETVVTTIRTNGVIIGSINDVPLSSSFTDFRVGTFAVASYSDAGQDPQYGGSLLAHGIVDNVLLTLPPPAVGGLGIAMTNGIWQVQFLSRSNWVYALERTADFQTWTPASPGVPSGGGMLTLQDTNPAMSWAFYRVRAERP